MAEANKLPTRAAGKGRALFPDARSGEHPWILTEEDPGDGWTAIGLVAKDWTKTEGGIGMPGTPNATIRYRWDSKNIWMRTQFGLQAIPETLNLVIHHDEDVVVYLNNEEIYRGQGFLTDYKVVPLGEKAIQVLQTGKNVIAVHCMNRGGGQFIDLNLTTGSAAGEPLPVPEILKRGGGKLAEALKKASGRDLAKEHHDRRQEIERLRRQPAGTPILAVKEFNNSPADLHVHIRGSAHAKGDPVVPAFPVVLSADPQAPEATIPGEYVREASSGRRRALADWMTDPGNPLTSRVMVNRLWQHHFGRGICPTPSDFGRLGEQPTHPELLDHLARELMRRGWSLKEMHRYLMTSNTYRMSSKPDSSGQTADPANHLFWRFNMRRLTAEELRDSLLAVTGELNLEMGGPPVFHPLPQEVLATSSKPGSVWSKSPPEQANRRTIYVKVKRSLRVPMLADHDMADTDNTCAARFSTTVPTQALGMLNSAWVNERAARLGNRLRAEAPDNPDAQIRLGLSLALQRPPADPEIAHLNQLHQKLESDLGLNPTDSLNRLCLVILNLNEFIYLD